VIVLFGVDIPERRPLALMASKLAGASRDCFVRGCAPERRPLALMASKLAGASRDCFVRG